MKILHLVEFYHPSVGGAQEVVRHISERMVRAGHEVTVATSWLSNRNYTEYNGVKIVSFKISGNSVRGYTGNIKEYQDFLRSSKFDIVMGYAAQQWTVDAFLEIADQVSGKKMIVPCGYSALNDPAYVDYFNKLPTALQKLDATIYMADDYQDTNFGRKHNLKNMVLITNGANENEFSEPLDNDRKLFLQTKYALGGLKIITVGLYGEKGHMELLRAFKRLPLANATLISVGSIRPHEGCYDEFTAQANRVNNSKKFIGKRVVMVDGSQKEEVHDLMKLSDIFAFFSNIECSPLVLFEAAAAGLPFIATDVGNSREIAAWTEGGLIAKTHSIGNSRVRVDNKDAVLKLTRMAFSPSLRRKLGDKGRKNWIEKFTWKKLTNDYLDLYQTLLEGKKPKEVL